MTNKESNETNKTGAADQGRHEIVTSAIRSEKILEKVLHPDHGASIVFIGTTREHTHGKRTVLLEYEAYTEMALTLMRQIGDEIAAKWPGALCAMAHRIGRVDIGEASVCIAVSTPHRPQCYEASRYAIDRLKQIVPIWKREIFADDAEWKGYEEGPWNPTQPLDPC